MKRKYGKTQHTIDVVVVALANNISVRTVQQEEQYGENKGTLGPAYHIDISIMSGSQQGEEGGSFMPAENATVSLDAERLDELLAVLQEHRSRMKVLS